MKLSSKDTKWSMELPRVEGCKVSIISSLFLLSIKSFLVDVGNASLVCNLRVGSFFLKSNKTIDYFIDWNLSYKLKISLNGLLVVLDGVPNTISDLDEAFSLVLVSSSSSSFFFLSLVPAWFTFFFPSYVLAYFLLHHFVLPSLIWSFVECSRELFSASSITFCVVSRREVLRGMSGGMLTSSVHY